MWFLPFGLLLCLMVTYESRPARAESLPKIVWSYQEEVEDNFIHTLCLNRARRALQQSRWVLEILTPSNLFLYLREHEQYKEILRIHPKLIFTETIQIIKVLILKEYGGIWLDPSTILLQSVDWIHELKTLQDVETFGSKTYEMVLFSSGEQGSEATSKQEDEQFSVNLGIILALKNSSLLTRWSAEFAGRLKEKVDPSSSEIMDLRQISSSILQTILRKDVGTLSDWMREQKIWRFKYSDFHLSFTQFANSPKSSILVDFYIRYPIDPMSMRLLKSKYFISLGHVSSELNEIINPNISKLAYMNNNQILGFALPVDAKCFHYLEQTSIVYEFLLKGTSFESFVSDLLDKDQRISKNCKSVYWQLIVTTTYLSVKYTLILICVYIAVKIQKLCLQLFWVKLKRVWKPKYFILVSILKSIKNVIQEESNHQI